MLLALFGVAPPNKIIYNFIKFSVLVCDYDYNCKNPFGFEG